MQHEMRIYLCVCDTLSLLCSRESEYNKSISHYICNNEKKYFKACFKHARELFSHNLHLSTLWLPWKVNSGNSLKNLRVIQSFFFCG